MNEGTISYTFGVHSADISYVRDQVTSCENGFLNTTSKHDSLANTSRGALFVRPAGSNGGFLVPVSPMNGSADSAPRSR